MTKKKRQNKKGLELSVNTIIILVIVVIVLVAVAAFFFGSFGNLTDNVKRIFFGSSAGYDEALAVQNCETYCDQLNSYSELTQERISNSAYCNRYFDVDRNNDGTADTRVFCPPIEPPGKIPDSEGFAKQSLNVRCNDRTTGQQVSC